MVYQSNTRPRPLFAVVAAVAVFSLPSVLAEKAAYPLTTDSNCHCYKTNATSANYFGHHQFFDFRQLNQYVNVPGVKPDPDSNANAPPPTNYFQSSNWASTWGIQNWNNSQVFKINNSDITGSDASILMVNSPNNIYIERNADNQASSQTHLTMRTVRLKEFQTAAEFESISQGYQYVSVRMFARTKGAPGAVTAMFTYRPGPNNSLALVQEADLEIRTVDPPNFVQYTNQPSWNSTGDIPQATRNASLPSGRRWSDWAYYRLDWTPGSSTWYVNGQLVSTISFQAPRDPAQIMFNNWSDGGSWSGNMSINSQAYLQIQWIEMVYNNTDPQLVKSGKCINVCTIDETSKIGVPALLTNIGQGTGGNQGGQGGQGGQTGGQTGACQSAHWGQCAGKNWNGCKSCAAGTTCKFQNDYYSQCL
ncbi:concanavalin A-like lectin/glucanase [Coniochaeta ligniaria NRRL 30616]|uniref:Concanavalin A-like lectin/glucanase n=1 Tax=Coniochaeta ligniaria NRRL 30616 TaxID=1408157 RepID=A0A1J7J6M6_9PEZI|nr:concanavalin A-like lectin/glucanase [Coniochaeta ligniaria NRRL 30616]